ncbi:MAG TPA: glycosyltransferase family 39 protein [Candidatus Methylacidiphilales bacterium]|nr:glycosyltransferase family 39 protein [Candidatus Methylacidiphilales bacterium]
MKQPGYRKRTVFLLVALLLVRFWFGQTFELSGQEAYLWLQGHNLSPAYWERGPFVPWLIRVGTLFFGDTELGVRWLAAVIACTSGFIVFYVARHWFDARSAFWTVVLFILVPMYAWKLSFMTEAAVSTGLMALTLFAFCRALEEDRLWWWLLGGASCGLALLVAMANAWWIVGLILYFEIDAKRRARLSEVRPWISVVLACLFLTPLVWWWRGSQVADVLHTRIANSWPLRHGFSWHEGFHFIWMEIWYLCPLFFILLAVALWRLGRRLWHNSHYALLVCLALPGLVWQNLAAFFQEGRFDLTPALFLPLVLLTGGTVTQLALTQPRAKWAAILVLAAAGLQSLSGLNPFYLAPSLNGKGYQILRTQSGENVNGFDVTKRQISWRNLADAVQSLQRDQGATLIIADSPETASALSFYLPRNPFVYVEDRPGVITHFDFWPRYDESASPNDSALFIGHSTDPDVGADPPLPGVVQDFAAVMPLDDPPLPNFDRSWKIWICRNFIGSNEQPAPTQIRPTFDSGALPK